MTKFAKNISRKKNSDNKLILEQKVHKMRIINFWVGRIEILVDYFHPPNNIIRDMVGDPWPQVE